MNINQFTPMPKKVIVKKLEDDSKTNSGIIVTTVLNKVHEYIEVISVGRDISTVKPGQKCLIMGKGIYETLILEDETFYILNEADIFAILE